MNKIMLSAVFIALTALWGTFSVSAGGKKEAAQVDAGFVAAKCSKCHKINKICSEVGKKSAAEWEKIVREMVERGADLDESEQKQTTDFIAALPEGKNALCP
jgi:hypothetical protein